jgi:hypothetical protein
MKVRVANTHRDKSMLVSVAESIGSTLGTIAAKVNAVQNVTLRACAQITCALLIATG